MISECLPLYQHFAVLELGLTDFFFLFLPGLLYPPQLPFEGLISASSWRSSVLVSLPCCTSFTLVSSASPSWTTWLSAS